MDDFITAFAGGWITSFVRRGSWVLSLYLLKLGEKGESSMKVPDVPNDRGWMQRIFNWGLVAFVLIVVTCFAYGIIVGVSRFVVWADRSFLTRLGLLAAIMIGAYFMFAKLPESKLTGYSDDDD